MKKDNAKQDAAPQKRKARTFEEIVDGMAAHSQGAKTRLKNIVREHFKTEDAFVHASECRLLMLRNLGLKTLALAREVQSVCRGEPFERTRCTRLELAATLEYMRKMRIDSFDLDDLAGIVCAAVREYTQDE